MSYNPNSSPLVCFFNSSTSESTSLISFARFDTSLFEGQIDASDNTILSSQYSLHLTGDIRYTGSYSGGLRSLSYFELDGTNQISRGRNENGAGQGNKGVSPEICFASTTPNQSIKLENDKKSSTDFTYSIDYNRVTGLVQ